MKNNMLEKLDIAGALSECGERGDVVHGKYFIDESGVITTASGKHKKLMKDKFGRDMVSLDTKDGGCVVYHVTDLLHEVFGAPDPDNWNLWANFKNTDKKYKLINETTGEKFYSMAEAARSIDMNYDKFYNKFYGKNVRSVDIDGQLFSFIDESNSEGDEEVK